MQMEMPDKLIPPPPVVRERLAASLRYTSLLRRLLRLSIRATEERHRQTAIEAHQTAQGERGEL